MKNSIILKTELPTMAIASSNLELTTEITAKNSMIVTVTIKNTETLKAINGFYRKGSKVCIVSAEYTSGIVDDIKIRKDTLLYTVRAHRKGTKELVLTKLPAEALIPYVKKWQYLFLRFFRIV